MGPDTTRESVWSEAIESKQQLTVARLRYLEVKCNSVEMIETKVAAKMPRKVFSECVPEGGSGDLSGVAMTGKVKGWYVVSRKEHAHAVSLFNRARQTFSILMMVVH